MLFMAVFCGDDEGAGVEVAAGICMPCMFSMPVCPGDDAGFGVLDCDGMFMFCMFMPCLSCFLSAGRALLLRRAVALAFDPAFRFAFGLAFGLDIFMPGISCMSCP